MKKTIATLMACALATSAVVPAMASDIHVTDKDWNESQNGYIGESDVTLEVVDEGGGEDPVIFSAYVPAVLPIVMDLGGNITVPTNAVIRNGVETKDIKVSAINVSAANGWSLANFDDVASLADDSKAIGMKLNNDVMGEDGQVTLTDGNWVIAKNEGDPELGKLALDMEVAIPKQSAHTNGVANEIATIGFTFGWAE